jgi:hypothetical protein
MTGSQPNLTDPGFGRVLYVKPTRPSLPFS